MRTRYRDYFVCSVERLPMKGKGPCFTRVARDSTTRLILVALGAHLLPPISRSMLCCTGIQSYSYTKQRKVEIDVIECRGSNWRPSSSEGRAPTDWATSAASSVKKVMHVAWLHRTFLGPSFLGFLDLFSQLWDKHRAQGCDKILLPDEYAFLLVLLDLRLQILREKALV